MRSTSPGLIAALLLAAGHVAAEDGPPRLAVAGAAERSVPVDEVEIVLSLRTESGSFADSAAAAGPVREKLAALPACAAREPVAHTLTVFAEDRISHAAEGKGLDHLLAVQCRLAEPGVRGIATAVDAALAVSDALTLKSVTSGLARETELRLERELLAEAIADARKLAEEAAAKGGARVGAVHRIDFDGRDAPDDGRHPFEERHRPGRVEKFTVRKPPDVAGKVPDQVEVSAGVRVEFELARP
jgi:uncharacterized protein YggE